jgi:hypothetical protein
MYVRKYEKINKKSGILPPNFKNAEFHADFESIEKVVKKCTQKSLKQNKFDEHE